MRRVTITDAFDRAEGPLVRVEIHLTRVDIRRRRRNREPIPQPVSVLALVDTGAECTAITPAIAARLTLPMSKFRLANAPALSGWTGGLFREASLGVVHPSGAADDDLVLPYLEILELDLNTLGYDALLGRDVLARCVLTYDGPAGSFTLAYSP